MKIDALVKLTLAKHFRYFTLLWMTHLASNILALIFVITYFFPMLFGYLVDIYNILFDYGFIVMVVCNNQKLLNWAEKY